MGDKKSISSSNNYRSAWNLSSLVSVLANAFDSNSSSSKTTAGGDRTSNNDNNDSGTTVMMIEANDDEIEFLEDKYLHDFCADVHDEYFKRRWKRHC